MKRVRGPLYDLAIIGGGINGCGIARDAQGRGLSVLLVEMDDLAGATSSASTKLIHGGLRYLEFYEFRMVRQALTEREILLRSAPHIVRPLRFILPHHTGLRPWPVIRLGLFFYDHLGGRRILPATRSVNLKSDPAGPGLSKAYRRAFEYSDCWVEDARLVILNARDAADRGADIRTRTKCVAARREGQFWHLTLQNQRDGSQCDALARGLVNAAGPWVSNVIAETVGLNSATSVRLVKGSHIVVDRIFNHEYAYTFQNADGRICFAIPFEGDFTLIGTTDEDFEGNPAEATISEHETDYLLASVSEYLEKPIARDTIRWSYSGVRPLIDDGAARPQDATRDYILERDAPDGAAPLLSVFGGKITTYRRLAESALDQLADMFPDMRPSWTHAATLPGGDIPVTAFDQWAAGIAGRYSFLDPGLIGRLCRAYGSRVANLLAGINSADDLGYHFGAGLTEREVDYLMRHEWAETADDLLWRRSKLGLRFTAEQRAMLESYLQATGHSSERAAAGGQTS
ncbi:MAG TPA: glycerol-3-phosphate dehydrogenase [Gammaproteobacteria bacterium]|nr:glycerol-3-phosphate dehydrogenase [Gammaproteobacteria bacterium]